MLKKWYKKNIELVELIIISSLMYFVAIVICKIYPFGGKSLIAGDIAGQYIPFWTYLKDCFTGKQSAFFSFSKLLGGNMVGIWAYYLLSPYNLILLFFPKRYLVETIILLTGIKIVSSAITMYAYLRNKVDSKILLITLCLCYAFCGYVVAFQMNVMWLDNIILLPLIILGLEKIVDKNDFKLYVITMSLSLIFNFYIGFSTALFSVLYYLYYYAIKPKFEVKKFIIKSLKFAFYSLISVGISAIVLIPVLYILKGGRGASFTIDITNMFKSNFKLLELASKTLFGTINNSEVYNGLPNIYAGLIIVLFIELYFTSRNISIRNKIVTFTFVVMLIISFKTNIINLIWHGLKMPVGFQYRYSFTFIFLVISLAGNLANELKKSVKIRHIIAWCLINVIGLLIIKYQNYNWATDKAIIVSLVMIIAYTILLSLYANIKKEIFTKIICMLCIVELTANYVCTFNQVNHLEKAGYSNTLASYEKVLTKVKEYDQSFYRMEKTDNFYLNDALLWNYNGIGHSSSTFDNEQTNFIKKIGYNWYMDFPSYGFGNTIITDSILGIKYLVSRNDELKYYTDVAELENGYKLYKNNYSLSLGYLTPKYVENVTLDNKNPFEIQEELLNNISNKNMPYFNDVEQTNLKLSNVEENDGYYQRTVIAENESYIEISYNTINATEVLYFFVDTPYQLDESAFKIYINDQYIDSYVGANKQGVIPINNYDKTLKIRLTFNNDENIKINNIMLKELNLENFEEAYQTISIPEHNLEDIEYKDNKLQAKIQAEKEGYLFTTIPYDEGWTALVDNEKVYIQNSNGFICFKINEGNHNVTLKYMPQGLKLGGIISLISLVILIISCSIFQKTRSNKNEKNIKE